jgi:hypothetical protein
VGRRVNQDSASHLRHIFIGPEMGVVFFWKFGLAALLHQPRDSLCTVFLSGDTRRTAPQNWQVAHTPDWLAAVSTLPEGAACSPAITTALDEAIMLVADTRKAFLLLIMVFLYREV